MSYSTIANQIVFSTAWENYPYTSGIGGAGDLYYFDKPGSWNFHEGPISKTYVKLNVRKKLRELYPEKFPNMDTVGYAVRYLLRDLGVDKYISAEDRGWESSDYWATLEAVFIPKEDYEKKVLSKINHIAKDCLCPYCPK